MPKKQKTKLVSPPQLIKLKNKYLRGANNILRSLYREEHLYVSSQYAIRSSLVISPDKNIYRVGTRSAVPPMTVRRLLAKGSLRCLERFSTGPSPVTYAWMKNPNMANNNAAWSGSFASPRGSNGPPGCVCPPNSAQNSISGKLLLLSLC